MSNSTAKVSTCIESAWKWGRDTKVFGVSLLDIWHKTVGNKLRIAYDVLSRCLIGRAHHGLKELDRCSDRQLIDFVVYNVLIPLYSETESACLTYNMLKRAVDNKAGSETREGFKGLTSLCDSLLASKFLGQDDYKGWLWKFTSTSGT